MRRLVLSAPARNRLPFAALVSMGCTSSPPPVPPQPVLVPAPEASRPAPVPPSAGEDEWDDYVPPDDWVTFRQTPHPEFTSIRIKPGAPLSKSAPPVCAALYRRYARAPDLAWFACAKATTGETWAGVAWIGPLPPEDSFTTRGRWRVVVDRNGRVQEGPEQKYEIVLGEGCETPPACFVGQHYTGVTPPTDFWLVDLDGDKVSEALALSYEALSQVGASESAVTLWQLTSSGGGRGPGSVVLHDLSRSLRIFGAADCDGDHRPEVVVNPYATPDVGDFRLRFGNLVRSSSEFWSLLGQFDKTGQWVTDGPLARAYAAKQCPAAPGNPFSGRPSSWPAQLHCAKLWGANSRKLRAELRAACSQPRDEATATACSDNQAALERMAQATLPLTLQAADTAAAWPKGCFENYEGDPP